MSRALAVCRLLLCGLVLAAISAADGASPGARDPLTRQQLVGAWRLVRIDYAGSHGPLPDPFYQPGSRGLIVYDASGWMSVQIGAPSRTSRDKAAAYDTYYAYYGTWDFDAATSVVTHHVAGSLDPAEVSLDYAQIATLEDGRLVFRGRDSTPGRETLRTKVWERLTAGGR